MCRLQTAGAGVTIGFQDRRRDQRASTRRCDCRAKSSGSLDCWRLKAGTAFLSLQWRRRGGGGHGGLQPGRREPTMRPAEDKGKPFPGQPRDIEGRAWPAPKAWQSCPRIALPTVLQATGAAAARQTPRARAPAMGLAQRGCDNPPIVFLETRHGKLPESVAFGRPEHAARRSKAPAPPVRRPF